MVSEEDACRELNLPPSATRDEVEQAFRERARYIHPDVSGGSSAAFRRAKDARDALLQSGPSASSSSSARSQRSPFGSRSSYDAYDTYAAAEEEPSDSERKQQEGAFWRDTKRAAREQEPRRRRERARAGQKYWARKAAGVTVPGSRQTDLAVALGTAAALGLMASTLRPSASGSESQ